MNLTHLTIYISSWFNLMCIFAVRKPQKSHTVDAWRQSTLKSQNSLSLNYNISAVFGPILLQKRSFQSSFCPRFIIMQYFWPVVFLLHKILLYVDRILVYLRRFIGAQSQAFESAAITSFRGRLMYDTSKFADSDVRDFWPCSAVFCLIVVLTLVYHITFCTWLK